MIMLKLVLWKLLLLDLKSIASDIYLSLPSESDILRYILTCRASAIYGLPINLRYIYKRVSSLVGTWPDLAKVSIPCKQWWEYEGTVRTRIASFWALIVPFHFKNINNLKYLQLQVSLPAKQEIPPKRSILNFVAGSRRKALQMHSFIWIPTNARIFLAENPHLREIRLKEYQMISKIPVFYCRRWFDFGMYFGEKVVVEAGGGILLHIQPEWELGDQL